MALITPDCAPLSAATADDLKELDPQWLRRQISIVSQVCCTPLFCSRCFNKDREGVSAEWLRRQISIVSQIVLCLTALRETADEERGAGAGREQEEGREGQVLLCQTAGGRGERRVGQGRQEAGKQGRGQEERSGTGTRRGRRALVCRAALHRSIAQPPTYLNHITGAGAVRRIDFREHRLR